MAPALGAVLLSGCAVFDGGVETAKTIWGSSTRALEHARGKAISKTYDEDYWALMRGVVEICQKKRLLIFKKDEIKGYLVLMHAPQSVDTTEVGVYFVELGENKTRIEVASLSTNAKRMTAKLLFHQLDILFGLVPPDPVDPPPGTDASKES